MSLSDVPAPPIEAISSFLSAIELSRFSLANREIYSISTENRLVASACQTVLTQPISEVTCMTCTLPTAFYGRRF